MAAASESHNKFSSAVHLALFCPIYHLLLKAALYVHLCPADACFSSGNPDKDSYIPETASILCKTYYHPWKARL